MSILTNILKGKVIKSIIHGITDIVPVKNAVSSNINSETGGRGKIDWVRLVTYIGTLSVVIFVLYLYSTGRLEDETFNLIIKKLFNHL